MNTNHAAIKGLILKDLYNLKKSFKFLIPFFMIYGMISLLGGNFSIITALMTTVTVLIPMYTYSYDHASHWTEFAVMMPISRRTLVTARYVLSLLMVGIASLILIPAHVITCVMDSHSPGDGLLISAFTIGTLILFLGIICFSVYRFGLERGRFIILGICLLPMALVLLFYQLLPPAASTAIRGWFYSQKFLGIIGLNAALWIGACIFLIISFLCMWISWKFSVRIVEKQEY